MSFVFYDAETTGSKTAFDQILQFAAIRTDEDLNPIGQRLRTHTRSGFGTRTDRYHGHRLYHRLRFSLDRQHSCTGSNLRPHHGYG